MGLLASVFGIKLPAWVYELIAAVLVAGILVAYGMRKEHTIIEHQVEKQQVIVEKKVEVTNEAEQAELKQLRAYRAAHPVSDIPDLGLCVAGNGGASPAPSRSEGAPAGNLQPVSPGDSGVQQVRAGRPILGMLDALAGRADEVSAAYRRRQSLEP